ncbi:MAG TPA: tRNA (adenosine(37)-N6)-dimethylallyltransferase MiaA, partial [Candidatus Udaeobacter sp.]|nr:tRNA (adenosine(37)-N6)-dimethylallyltransferase MiaA [Candidatus Udaeobacter sp.]
ATGKTAVGIALAERLGGEIISADSRQVYRGMTIGTSKPTPEEQARVPHHLLDVADPLSHYTAADFARDARAVIAALDQRGVPAIVVGGSGLYLRALIDGLFAGPGRQPELRAELEAWADREGSGALHAELVRVDPESARRLHPNDRVRLVRALEVVRTSGKPLSEWQRERADHSLRERTRYVVLDREDPDLDARIATRTRAMFQGGLIEEARALLAQGLSPEHATYRTIGYTEAFAVVRGEMPMAAAVIAAIQSTRQFARRQRTWFRGVAGSDWVALSAGDSAEAVADLLAE